MFFYVLDENFLLSATHSDHNGTVYIMMVVIRKKKFSKKDQHAV